MAVVLVTIAWMIVCASFRNSKPTSSGAPSTNSPSRRASAQQKQDFHDFIAEIDPHKDTFEDVRFEFGVVAVLVVTSDWHYEPKALRMQVAAQMLDAWRYCFNRNAQIRFIDVAGNTVGGTKAFSETGVYVID